MWTFGRKIAVGFALSFTLLLAIGAVAFRSVTTLTSASYVVTHTHEVLDDVSRILSSMKDAETGQRGYVITGDDAFLEPYVTGIDTALKGKEELRQSTLENPAQQRRIDELDSLVGLKLEEMKRVVDIRRTSGFEAAQRIVAEGAGKRTMDSIRRVMAEVE
jgi:methyl-accepting chemotaxis protein